MLMTNLPITTIMVIINITKNGTENIDDGDNAGD